MSLLSSPKVRLALIVNGLYFISLLTPSAQPQLRARLVSHVRAVPSGRAARVYTKTTPAEAPRSAPSKAVVYESKSGGQSDVYLTDDLTLVSGLGHTLLLSPTFNTTVDNPEPRSVLMRFVSYSDEQHYDDAVPLVITADGQGVWDDTDSARAASMRPNSGRHSITAGGDGQFIETVGVEIPYDIFAEVADAQRVVIRLGDDCILLRPEQVEALRDMHRRLPQPPDDASPSGRPTYNIPYRSGSDPAIVKSPPDELPPDRRR